MYKNLIIKWNEMLNWMQKKKYRIKDIGYYMND